MEHFLESMMNSKKIPRLVKFIIITIIYGILEAVFALVMVNSIEFWSKLLCLTFAIIIAISYLINVFRIIIYNRVGEEKEE